MPIVLETSGLYVHSFDDILPPARYDGTSWTSVTVEEAAGASGPWTPLGSYPVPADATPETPQPLDLTVSASLEQAWFRFRFTDANGDASPFSAAVASPGDISASYATVQEMRDRYQALADTTRYPDDAVQDALRTAEEIIEDACAVAFVPRTVVSTVLADGTRLLTLPYTRVRQVIDVTVDDATLTSSDLDLLVVNAAGLYRAAGWAENTRVVVTYTHGYDQPPGRVKEAVMLLAKTRLVIGPVDERATSMTTEDGGTISLITPGVRGSITGIPEVDATIEQYGERAVVIA